MHYFHHATNSEVWIAPDDVKTIHKHGRLFRSFVELKKYERSYYDYKVQSEHNVDIHDFKNEHYKAKGEQR